MEVVVDAGPLARGLRRGGVADGELIRDVSGQRLQAEQQRHDVVPALQVVRGDDRVAAGRTMQQISSRKWSVPGRCSMT
jgi:hypothetical protein